MRRQDLVARLAAAADDLGELAAPADVRAQLTAMCTTLRQALAAAACSVARLDGDALVYEAADGEGAAEIVGVRLSVGRGLAGYVARTGQAMIVDQLHADKRFARDVAERTGYVPSSLLVVPVYGAGGEVVGVVSVLDRGATGGDALALATTVAAQAALLLPQVQAVATLGPVLLRAVADAGAAADPSAEWPAALRRAAAAGAAGAAGPSPDGLPELLAALAELRVADPEVGRAAARIVADLAALTARRQPRRLR